MAHPPVRGQPWLFTQPLVHVGFLKSWLAGGLNEKVVTCILQLVQARPAQAHAQPLRIYVTGTPLRCCTAACALVMNKPLFYPVCVLAAEEDKTCHATKALITAEQGLLSLLQLWLEVATTASVLLCRL